MDFPDDTPRRIGAGGPAYDDHTPSSAWYPQLVTPGNFLDYWNDIDSHRWPFLAAHWLAGGFDSDRLRWLAALDERDAREMTTDQMVTVLRSVGVEIELTVEFVARCDLAIARIQPDLDATGFGTHRMRAANAVVGHDARPAVYAALPDGSWWSSGSDMTPDMDNETLMYVAAQSVSDTLMEVLRVLWPTCSQHAGPPMTLEEAPDGDSPVWRCDRGHHDAAPLGQLTRAMIDR